MANSEHMLPAIDAALDESTLDKPAVNRRVIDVVRFKMKLVSYLTRREHDVFNAGVERGRELERKLAKR